MSLDGGAIKRARHLRRNMTDAEVVLWRALRETFPHLHWRHQVPFGRSYTADFCSHRAKLIIEADGGQHASAAAQAHDQNRARFLNSEGYRLLRFWNHDVLANTDGVIRSISLSLREREGAAERLTGEGAWTPARSPSPSHSAAPSGPLPLPPGEGFGEQRP